MSGSSGEKTEQPTPKKIRDARNKGQVAKSQDVSAAALTVTCFAIITLLFYRTVQEMQDMILLPTKFYEMDFRYAYWPLIEIMTYKVLFLSLPLLAAVAVVTVYR